MPPGVAATPAIERPGVAPTIIPPPAAAGVAPIDMRPGPGVAPAAAAASARGLGVAETAFWG